MKFKRARYLEEGNLLLVTEASRRRHRPDPLDDWLLHWRTLAPLYRASTGAASGHAHCAARPFNLIARRTCADYKHRAPFGVPESETCARCGTCQSHSPHRRCPIDTGERTLVMDPYGNHYSIEPLHHHQQQQHQHEYSQHQPDYHQADSSTFYDESLGAPSDDSSFSDAESSSCGAYSSPDQRSENGGTGNASSSSSSGSRTWRRKRRCGHQQVHQRQAANLRERRRMQSINDAFEGLRTHIPTLPYEKRLSKVMSNAFRRPSFLSAALPWNFRALRFTSRYLRVVRAALCNSKLIIRVKSALLLCLRVCYLRSVYQQLIV